MMAYPSSKGFSLIELLVSLSVTLLIMTGVTQMMLQNSRINRKQQLTAEVQSNARNCLSMIVQRLRSAGWDPLNAGIATVTLDSDSDDDINEIEVFADLDSDGTTDGMDEQVLIRHVGNQIEWRRSNDVDEPFVVLAVNITRFGVPQIDDGANRLPPAYCYKTPSDYMIGCVGLTVNLERPA